MNKTAPHSDYRANSKPVFWVMKALSLRQAAFALRDVTQHELNVLDDHVTGRRVEPAAPTVQQVEHALLGFALEVVLKAIILKKNPDYQIAAKLPTGFMTHKLVSLAKKADQELTRDEKAVCMNLTNYMTVWFRYPVGKDEHSHKNIVASARPGNYNCRKVFDTLFARWVALLWPNCPYI